VSTSPYLLAQSGNQPSSKGTPNIDPDAMAALNKMGAYLRSLKAFHVDSEITNDDVLEDGQILTDNKMNTLLAVSPSLLRAELKSDDNDVFFSMTEKTSPPTESSSTTTRLSWRHPRQPN